MTIQGRRFDLSPAYDRGQLQKAAVDAIQAGGAIIDVPVEGGGQVSVLLSCGVPVFFETHTTPDEQPDIFGVPFDEFSYELTDWE
jgi:hypothetical protein